MKGFSHFIAGLAVTSFFPWTIQAASQGNPLYFILGGTCALLPDTLDFRFIRYFYRHDVEIVPDPLSPDMQMVADTIAQTIDAAQQKSLRLRLHTIRLDSDTWQRYRIQVDPHQQQVTATLEERIDTGGNPVGTPTPSPSPIGAAYFHQPVSIEYLASFPVEMFDGPHLELAPSSHGETTIMFIPWHRRYTHSLCFGFILAGIAIILGTWQAAIVVWCAHASHVMLDQLGYMGSNLLWPLYNKRFPGLKLQHAASSFWNFAAVWISITLIYNNLHSHTPGSPPIPPIGYLLAGIVLPLTILHRWLGTAN